MRAIIIVIETLAIMAIIATPFYLVGRWLRQRRRDKIEERYWRDRWVKETEEDMLK